MDWSGTIIGGLIGYLAAGSPGVVIGLLFGFFFDRGVKISRSKIFTRIGIGNTVHIQSSFFTTTFSVMGYLAKADGRITANEVELAKNIMSRMQLNTEQTKSAIRLFQEGKRPGFPYKMVLLKFRRDCGYRKDLLNIFLEIQLHAAFADGALHNTEKRLLVEISQLLKVSIYEFVRLETIVRSRYQFASASAKQNESYRESLSVAYKILGLRSNSTDSEIKKAYRRLMSKLHPDKLVSKGLPKEMTKLAAAKVHDVRNAYDQLRDVRGF